MVQPDRPQMII